jgi:pimeloyl-ACP methyl ester carboxylesterase
MAVAEELKVSSLIMWGSANFPNTRTDLSRSTIPTLVVQGSSDKLCDMDEVKLAEFQRDFPLNAVYKTIQGGGHSWFASIEVGDSTFEGVPTISMEQQQEQAAAITAKFLTEI